MSLHIPPDSRILFVDDQDARHEWFMRAFKGMDCFHAHRYSQAIEMLQAHRFDLVFLDHDLDMDNNAEKDYNTAGYGGARDFTGADVAWFMISDPKYLPQQVIVHSVNDTGGRRIADILKPHCEAHIIQFTELIRLVKLPPKDDNA